MHEMVMVDGAFLMIPPISSVIETRGEKSIIVQVNNRIGVLASDFLVCMHGVCLPA